MNRSLKSQLITGLRRTCCDEDAIGLLCTGSLSRMLHVGGLDSESSALAPWFCASPVYVYQP
jgi:hypothetical protein